MARRKVATPEGGVKLAVIDLLTAERIFCLRVNSGNILLTAPNGKKRMVVLAPPGTADIQAIVPAAGLFMVLWVETKFGKNGLSRDQIIFREDVLDRGHCYLEARSSDDVLTWLRRFRKMYPR